MKKLITICVIMATVFTVNAQDGKPTKEQTLEYLKSVLIGVEGGHYKRYGENAKNEYIFESINIALDDCTLTLTRKFTQKAIGFSFSRPDKIHEDDYTIDLSKIESFEIKVEKLISREYNHYNDNLSLYYDDAESKDNELFVYCSPEHAEKVLKALNHLRKLCGAPEPISFD